MTKRPNPIDFHVDVRVKMRRMPVSMSQENLREQLALPLQQVPTYDKSYNRNGPRQLCDLEPLPEGTEQ